MLEAIARSWFFRTAFLGTLAFYVAASLLDPDTFIIGLRLILIIVALAVFAAYSRDLARAMLARWPDAYERILLGILGSAAAYAMTSTVTYLWRLAGKPAWWLTTDLAAFPSWLAIQALLMHLWAKGALKRDVPNLHRVAFVGFVSLVAAGLASLLWFGGEVAAFLEWTRPFLDRR